jgi:phenylacetate-CoA ligase
MTFQAELDRPYPESEKLSGAVKKVIQEILRIRGEVHFIPKGSLPQRAKKIEDQRVWE